MDDIDTLLASRAATKPYVYSEGPDPRADDPNAPRIETAGVAAPATDPVEDLLSARASGKVLAESVMPTDKPRTIGDFYNFVTSQPFDAAEAFGHHVGNFTHGAAQLIENGLASGAETIAPGTSAAKYLRANADRTNAAMTEREKDYQERVPNSPGAYAGAALGEVVPFVVGGEGSIGNVLGNAGNGIQNGARWLGSRLGTTGEKVGNAIGRVASGAAQGATVSGIAPVTNQNGDYWSAKGDQMKTGAIVGATAPMVGAIGAKLAEAGQGIVNATRPIYNPKGAVSDALIRFLKDPQQVIANIDAAPVHVPGSKPTAAQVGGDPALVIAEKTVKNSPALRAAFEERSASNNAARLDALDSVAGTPEQLEAARAARGTSAGSLYDQANIQTVAPDSALKEILARPSALDAMTRAKRLAKERGEMFSIGSDASPNGSASLLLDQNGNPYISRSGQKPPQYPVSNLHYVKMALDDMLDGGRLSGIGGHEESSILNTKNDLLQWLDNTVPAYKAARQAYAKQSVPVNTMDAAQGLRSDLSQGALNAVGDVTPTLSSYNSKLAKARNAEYGLDPASEATLAGIQKDLQRESISNSIKSPGSDTAFNLEAPNWLARQLYGASLDGKSNFGKAAGGILGYATGGLVGATGGYLMGQKVGQVVGDRMRRKLADMLLNPEMTKAGLQEAMDHASRQTLIAQLLGNPATAALIQKSPQAVAYIANEKAIPAP